MTHEEVVAEVIRLVKPHAEGRVANITADTGLTGELALDSLKVMDLITDVEDHYEISVPLNTLADIKTVGQLATLIQTHVGKKA
ncbi:acyl carrier protein [Luteibacter aegosomaticola]|jgi:acyl carrier protein|uniref:acyl carrier protein n=1 Tax=Luteibacter aegosomaticola TaxID=2911538 RepID=UPI001FFC16DD|nr:acyl carrier protein [Luteibacter aegosomaticola]UPG90868.1 acyl carrier protein [Luteibacter aegosomaticola]